MVPLVIFTDPLPPKWLVVPGPLFKTFIFILAPFPKSILPNLQVENVMDYHPTPYPQLGYSIFKWRTRMVNFKKNFRKTITPVK